jgi:hypothetical protein
MAAMSAARRFAHKHGIARVLNSETGYGNPETVRAYVETALPLKALAYYAAHDAGLYHARIVDHEHTGLLRRRWTLRRHTR